MIRTHIPESNVGLAMIIKHRSGAGKIGEMHLVGQVKGSDCVIIDDMIDTAVHFLKNWPYYVGYPL